MSVIEKLKKMQQFPWMSLCQLTALELSDAATVDANFLACIQEMQRQWRRFNLYQIDDISGYDLLMLISPIMLDEATQQEVIDFQRKRIRVVLEKEKNHQLLFVFLERLAFGVIGSLVWIEYLLEINYPLKSNPSLTDFLSRGLGGLTQENLDQNIIMMTKNCCDPSSQQHFRHAIETLLNQPIHTKNDRKVISLLSREGYDALYQAFGPVFFMRELSNKTVFISPSFQKWLTTQFQTMSMNTVVYLAKSYPYLFESVKIIQMQYFLNQFQHAFQWPFLTAHYQQMSDQWNTIRNIFPGVDFFRSLLDFDGFILQQWVMHCTKKNIPWVLDDFLKSCGKSLLSEKDKSDYCVQVFMICMALPNSEAFRRVLFDLFISASFTKTDDMIARYLPLLIKSEITECFLYFFLFFPFKDKERILQMAKDSFDRNLLHNFAHCPQLLEDILNNIAIDDRLAWVCKKDVFGKNVLHRAHVFPESVRIIFSMLKEEDWSFLLQERDALGQTILHLAVSVENTFKIILNDFLKKEKIDRILDENNYGLTVYDRIRTKPNYQSICDELRLTDKERLSSQNKALLAVKPHVTPSICRNRATFMAYLTEKKAKRAENLEKNNEHQESSLLQSNPSVLKRKHSCS